LQQVSGSPLLVWFINCWLLGWLKLYGHGNKSLLFARLKSINLLFFYINYYQGNFGLFFWCNYRCRWKKEWELEEITKFFWISMFCFTMKHFQKRPRCQGKASINTNQYQMNVEVNEEQVKGKQKIIIYTLVLEGKFKIFIPSSFSILEWGWTTFLFDFSKQYPYVYKDVFFT